MCKNATWSYRRIYAKYMGLDEECRVYHHPYSVETNTNHHGKFMKRDAGGGKTLGGCYVSGDVRPAWIAEGAYAMELPLVDPVLTT